MKELDAMSTEELIDKALTVEDEEAAWDYVTTLHHRGTKEVFDAAAKLCSSENPFERSLGADIIGQLGVPKRAFPEEALEILHRMVDEEKDPMALSTALIAVGHTQPPEDDANLDHIVALKVHPDADVRFGVVQALSGRNDAGSVGTLVGFMSDEDDDVRDWATFGVASLIDTDTPEVRAALWERVSDKHEDTSCEALIGLSIRGDDRVYDKLVEKLNSEEPTTLMFEAAAELGDVRLLEPLKKLLEANTADPEVDEGWVESLREAIEYLEEKY